MSSHAQIRPQGAEKQLSKVIVFVGGMQPNPVTAIALAWQSLVNLKVKTVAVSLMLV